jgi:hypothetical protein
MRRGCLILFLVVTAAGALGIGWLLNVTKGDPFAIAYVLADWNGELSQWDERAGRIVKIDRVCDAGAPGELTAIDCSSNDRLQQYVINRLGELEAKRYCGNDVSFGNAKSCEGEIEGPTNGRACAIVESVDPTERRFRALVPFSSRDRAFYFYSVGDVIKIDLSQRDPSVAKLPLGDRKAKC